MINDLKCIAAISVFVGISSCANHPDLDLDNYQSRIDPPQLMQEIACLKEDGYTYAEERMYTFVSHNQAEAVTDQDYFVVSLSDQEDIQEIEFQIKKRSAEEIDTSILSNGLDQILIALVAKDFGEEFMDYDHCTIRIENWIYTSDSLAEVAIQELERIFEYQIQKDRYIIERHQERIFLFYVWEANKIPEMKRVALKVMNSVKE